MNIKLTLPPLHRIIVYLPAIELRNITWIIGGTQWTSFVPKHAGVTSFVSTGIDQFPFFTFVEWHIATGTGTWIR